MHDTGYKSALARRVCRYSDARLPRKTDDVLLESELPPRMRGKGRTDRAHLRLLGITPAYAGKSMTVLSRRWLFGDHPRVCGEKTIAVQNENSRQGAPPRMRGKGYVEIVDVHVAGITPAYAGKRLWCRGHGAPGQDYPRVCGEKSPVLNVVLLSLGSPPHMRGKGAVIVDELVHVGITPAYAGKRGRSPRPAGRRRDHPRVCEEKAALKARVAVPSGSTPAYAGKRSLALG